MSRREGSGRGRKRGGEERKCVCVMRSRLTEATDPGLKPGERYQPILVMGERGEARHSDHIWAGPVINVQLDFQRVVVWVTTFSLEIWPFEYAINIHSPTQQPTHSLLTAQVSTHPLTHPSPHSPTHPLTHSLTHQGQSRRS